MGFEDGVREVVAEEEIRSEIGRRLGVGLRAVPKTYHVDFAGFADRGLVAWFVTRDRPRNEWEAFGTLPLSVQRFAAVANLVAATGRPAFYAVRDLRQRIRLVDLAVVGSLLPGAILWGSPTTIGREGIRSEPVIHIPAQYFEPLATVAQTLGRAMR